MRPIEFNQRAGVIGLIVLLAAVISFTANGKDIAEILNPENNWLNWRFVTFLLIVTNLITLFLMNEALRREFAAHQRTRYERDNFENLLGLSEDQRMTDVVTGVPNGTKLTQDLGTFFTERRDKTQAQIILIDIRNFRQINREFGFLKGDQILRMVAQNIYPTMRRDEDMYKRSAVHHDGRAHHKTLYRRYPGGDEFIFLIEGDQSAAIGFVVNRLLPAFKSSLSEKASAILGREFPLSFHCAIAPLKRGDLAADALTRVDECYTRVAEDNHDFTLSWWPTEFEGRLKDGDYRKAFYQKARDNFHIITIGAENPPG